jgi:O-antigen/teichoic acid export membrane protein
VTAVDPSLALGTHETEEPLTVARNVSTRYLAIGIEMAVGLAVLPFNVAHLGSSAYGLWMLAASVTAYFSVLDLGYSGALVKFVAFYRAKRDVPALNEILSTLFCLFTAVGGLTYVVALLVSAYLDRLFHLTPDQASVGRIVLLVTSVNVAVGTAFTVFGAVINGFQRYDLNNVVGAASSVVVAVVNVVVLLAGFHLVGLVCATTAVRLVTYWVYRANAYRVFPGLRVRPSLFSQARLREVTSFSIYIAVIDWANKLNYSVDALVIGAFLNTSAVAVWSVGQRLAEMTQRLSNQLNEVLFPTFVDNDTSNRRERLQKIFVVGTRLSLATVVPIAGVLMLMAPQLIDAWVGPEFAGSVIVVRLLAFTVIVRVGDATAGTLLKAAGRHRLVAFANSAAAIVNLSLSIALVRGLGLSGVAIGTLVPVVALAAVAIFPAGCRRVGLPLGRVLAEAVWPAMWPAGVMAAYVRVTAPHVGHSLLAVAAEMAVAACIYALTFVYFGMKPHERRFFLDKLHALSSEWRGPIATVSENA